MTAMQKKSKPVAFQKTIDYSSQHFSPLIMLFEATGKSNQHLENHNGQTLTWNIRNCISLCLCTRETEMAAQMFYNPLFCPNFGITSYINRFDGQVWVIIGQQVLECPDVSKNWSPFISLAHCIQYVMYYFVLYWCLLIVLISQLLMWDEWLYKFKLITRWNLTFAMFSLAIRNVIFQ